MVVNGIFYAKKGAQFTHAQAQVYGSHLKKIEKKYNGILEPKVVVDDARKEESPTHNYFEWDDSICGEKHRLYQARHLMNSIEFKVVEMGDELVRAFFNIRPYEEDTPKQAYMSLSRIMSDDNYRRQVIFNALKEVKQWQKKYRIYKELKPIFEVIKGFEEEV